MWLCVCRYLYLSQSLGHALVTRLRLIRYLRNRRVLRANDLCHIPTKCIISLHLHLLGSGTAHRNISFTSTRSSLMRRISCSRSSSNESSLLWSASSATCIVLESWICGSVVPFVCAVCTAWVSLREAKVFRNDKASDFSASSSFSILLKATRYIYNSHI